MIVYPAARYARRLEIAAFAKQIEALGYQVNARWLTGAHETPDGSMPTDQQRAQWATNDLEDIRSANVFLAFTDGPTPHHSTDVLAGGFDVHAWRAGRNVEFGFAMTRVRHVWLCGPRENIFHYLPGIDVFDSPQYVLWYLDVMLHGGMCDCSSFEWAPEMGQYRNGHHPTCPKLSALLAGPPRG